jgi:sulfonate transport system permease protein
MAAHDLDLHHGRLGQGAPRLSAPAPLYRRSRPAWLSLAVRLAVPLVFILAWAAGSASGLIPSTVLASPPEVLRSAWEMSVSGVLWAHLSVSLARAAAGLTLGGAFGLVMGLAAGLSRTGEELIDPSAQMVRALPFLALVPLFIVWFGIGETSKILLIAAAAAKPIYLNAFGGVRNVDPKLIEAGRVFGLSRRRLVSEIYLPAAIPSLMVGLRLAMTMSLIALIAVEVINTSRGLGFLMLQAQEFFKIDVLVVCIVLYAIFGLCTDLMVRGLERALTPWRTGKAPTL